MRSKHVSLDLPEDRNSAPAYRLRHAIVPQCRSKGRPVLKDPRPAGSLEGHHQRAGNIPWSATISIGTSRPNRGDQGPRQALKPKAYSWRARCADVDKAAALFTGQVASGAAGTRDGIGTGFDAALASIATVFDELVARGCDRTKVPTDHRDINKQKLFFEATAPWSRRVEGVQPVCGGHDSAHRPMKN